MSDEFRAVGRDVLFSSNAVPEICIAEANTAIWAAHIATALNYWSRGTAADPLSVACPVFRCERPAGRRCLAIGSQGGMDGPPHRERIELAANAAASGRAMS